MFRTQGFIFGRQLYVQVWYGVIYIHQYKQTADTVTFLAPDFVLSLTVISSLRYATRSPFIFLCTLSLSASSSICCTNSTSFFKLPFLYAPLFAFHNSISARNNYVNSRQNALFEFILETLKEKNTRTVREMGLNWWRCKKNASITILASNCCTTCILRKRKIKVFGFLQHFARTVKPHYTQSDNLHSGLCCANCVNVFGDL